MLGHDRPGLMPAGAIAALAAWRARALDEQHAAIWSDGGTFAPGPRDGRLRVGLWAPCVQLGGAETWQRQLVRGVDPGRIAWMGLAVACGDVDPSVASAYEGLMTVARGRDAAVDLAGHCDLIISWGIEDIPDLVRRVPEGKRPKIVSACHAPAESAWGRHFYALPDGIDHWAAVSELALAAIPPSSLIGRPARVIWNAVDESRLVVGRTREEVRSSWGVPPGAKVAGFFGRLTSEKRADLMLDLADHLPPDWHVVIVGDGPDRAGLDRQKWARGLTSVHLIPGDPRAGDVLDSFDVLVVPSDYESFGLTMAEGLWMGVPVVSTPVGLAKMEPGLTRLVPPSPTGEVLSSAVQAAHVDGLKASETQHARRDFARSRLSSERFGREWTELICSFAPPQLAIDPALRDAVIACPDRGPVLPISEQDDCGCQGREVSLCLAGRGAKPGRVTLRDCLACVAGSPNQPSSPEPSESGATIPPPITVHHRPSSIG